MSEAGGNLEKEFSEHAEGEIGAFQNERDEYEYLLTQFDSKRQAKLLRKIDWHLLPVLAIFYLISFLDRANFGNAKLLDIIPDLGLTSTQFNLCLTIFFIPYGLFEVPSNVGLKFTKPSVWLPAIMTSWGLVMMCMGWAKGFSGLMAGRFFLGVTEAGLFPGATYLCSTWYPRYDMHFRIAIFYCAASIAGSFSGLLAYAIGYMEGIQGYSAWRWLFILEGLLTIVVALVSIPFICNSPATVRWLTPEEKRFISLRLQFDGHERGYVEPKFQKKYLIQAFTDLKVYLGCILFGTTAVGTYSLAYSLPTTINLLGYTKAQAQLLTIPVYAFGCVMCLANALVADKLQRRFPSIAWPYISGLIGVLICLKISPEDKPGVIYFAMFLIVAGLYPEVPAQVSWISNNLAGQWKRSTGMALEFSIGNLCGGIIGSNIFLAEQSPTFNTAYIILTAFFSWGFITATLQVFLLSRDNKKKRQLIESTPAEERDALAASTKDDGDKSPYFTYTL